ncbi:hypothetical protein Msil_2738 [Methylocella silvestris BL2]|uniref:Uncharacterized protein n=1 Tax=Methylocella silvestris (strain DSM 15510 / CIP 108128 / LMG 27833 / NCIMB 13906 / BL2) TaxID=395965 RepID=B8ERW2_METSB|nr:hypothetical protein [Methylocella silvestris]ACK51660.1 hypothetical protein Msil_2738 [Methylocella silvestris BL2]
MKQLIILISFLTIALACQAQSIVDLHSAYPPNYMGFSSVGAIYSLCPDGGCIGGDTLRAAGFQRLTTTQGPLIGEYTNFVTLHNATGSAPAWISTTAYPADSYVHSAASGSDQIYFSAQGGISGGTAPNCKSGTCSDGSILWTWQSGGINDQKVAFGIDGDMYAGAGHHWNAASALTIWPGSMPSLGGISAGGFGVNTEIDLANFDRDCPAARPGACQLYGLFMAGISSHLATVGILGGGAASPGLYHWGLAMLPGFAVDYGLNESSYAYVGIQQAGGVSTNGIAQSVGYHATGKQTLASLQLTASAPYAIKADGSYASGVIDTQSAATMYAMAMADNQAIGFDGFDATLKHSDGALRYAAGGDQRVALSDAGSLILSGHLSSNGNGPTLSGCGAGASLSVGSNDVHGTVTEGAGATSCAVIFFSAYKYAPDCVLQDHGTVGTTSMATTPTTLQWSHAAASSERYTYHCMGN